MNRYIVLRIILSIRSDTYKHQMSVISVPAAEITAGIDLLVCQIDLSKFFGSRLSAVLVDRIPCTGTNEVRITVYICNILTVDVRYQYAFTVCGNGAFLSLRTGIGAVGGIL